MALKIVSYKRIGLPLVSQSVYQSAHLSTYRVLTHQPSLEPTSAVMATQEITFTPAEGLEPPHLGGWVAPTNLHFLLTINSHCHGCSLLTSSVPGCQVSSEHEPVFPFIVIRTHCIFLFLFSTTAKYFRKRTEQTAQRPAIFSFSQLDRPGIRTRN